MLTLEECTLFLSDSSTPPAVTIPNCHFALKIDISHSSLQLLKSSSVYRCRKVSIQKHIKGLPETQSGGVACLGIHCLYNKSTHTNNKILTKWEEVSTHICLVNASLLFAVSVSCCRPTEYPVTDVIDMRINSLLLSTLVPFALSRGPCLARSSSRVFLTIHQCLSNPIYIKTSSYSFADDATPLSSLSAARRDGVGVTTRLPFGASAGDCEQLQI